MKFRSEKKVAIILYILEKISYNTPSLSRCVADTFRISTNTVHSYLNELLEENIIKKTKRGQYELVTETRFYHLERSAGHLDSDTYALKACLWPHIEHLAANVKEIWEYAFSEMTNNVMDHSLAEQLTVVIRKNYLETAVILMDNGVGIFEKIKNHFNFPTLDDAICELFKGKLTTDSENHSGEGIFFTSRMMDTFLIESGGKLFATTKYEDDRFYDKKIQPSGTAVFMSLSNFTKRTADEVFNTYSDVDGGFTQTRIPLKNIFDTSPVSRSQAKRICYRLDHFQEVILDFAGVNWMGQGFAHQLFVLYQKEHPQTRLIPENMSESVSNMYNHVINTAKR